MANTAIVMLGGTHSGWLPNSTPIQRALFLASVGDVLCIDVGSQVAPSLADKVRYCAIQRWSTSAVLRHAKPWFEHHTQRRIVWCGPSWKQLAIACRVARYTNAKLVLDLFDDLWLPNGIYRARGQHIMAYLHDLRAVFSKRHLKACDLLVRAIAMDPSACGAPADIQIGVMNGICQEMIERGENWHEHKWREDQISCAYVGVLDRERAGILEPLLRLAAANNRSWSLQLVGPIEQHFADAIQEAVRGSMVAVDIHGQLEWPKAMDIVQQADCCLYPFRSGRELDCVYPIKLGEYLALGKPCICSDLRGAREMAEEGGALFVDAHSPKHWYESIEMLRKSPPLCREKGVLARHRAMEITWDKLHSPLREALHDL
ncbi:MAG: glycosyltransferase family 4 protein [Deltaproteobacteria bacterium]|jgi:hypothetical protein|nr:glycosyltransferase family 4 protein [Deltaproteobacteria bacterium]